MRRAPTMLSWLLEINKMIPGRVVALPNERADKRPPAGALGLTNEMHVRLMWEPIGLA